MKVQMKTTKQLPKNVEEFYKILDQIESLVDQLRDLDYSDIPNGYGKDRMIDKVSDLGLELTDISEEISDSSF